MRFLTTAAAGLTLGGAVVSSAPLANTSANSANQTSLAPARRRASLGARTANHAAALNNSAVPSVYTRRDSNRSEVTKIEVRRTSTSDVATRASEVAAAMTAKIQAFSEERKTIMARKLQAGQAVHIGIVGVPCTHCKKDNYKIKKRDDTSPKHETREEYKWSDNAPLTAFYIILGSAALVLVVKCAEACICGLIARRSHAKAAREAQRARASSIHEDIEMANRGRTQEPALEEPIPAHTGRTAPDSAGGQATMHLPYSGRWNRVWFGK